MRCDHLTLDAAGAIALCRAETLKRTPREFGDLLPPRNPVSRTMMGKIVEKADRPFSLCGLMHHHGIKGRMDAFLTKARHLRYP